MKYYSAYARVTGQRLGCGEFENSAKAKNVFNMRFGGAIEVRQSGQPTLELADAEIAKECRRLALQSSISHMRCVLSEPLQTVESKRIARENIAKYEKELAELG